MKQRRFYHKKDSIEGKELGKKLDIVRNWVRLGQILNLGGTKGLQRISSIKKGLYVKWFYQLSSVPADQFRIQNIEQEQPLVVLPSTPKGYTIQLFGTTEICILDELIDAIANEREPWLQKN